MYIYIHTHTYIYKSLCTVRRERTVPHLIPGMVSVLAYSIVQWVLPDAKSVSIYPSNKIMFSTSVFLDV